MPQTRIGIWLIGARGGVATTTLVGLAALRRGLVGSEGLTTELPLFAGLSLPHFSDFVASGHEIRQVSLFEEARRLAREFHVPSPEVVDACRDELEAVDRRIRPGTVLGVGPRIAALASPEIVDDPSPRVAIDRLKADLEGFAAAEDLGHVTVVNVASTEPPADTSGLPTAWPELESQLEQRGPCPLPASTLYAIAALEAGCSYINFTPSLGSAPEAIDDLARRKSSRHMGCDGKTGETLMKSVLAPMFASRNLPVMSWVGHNIFGNLDGKVLDDPANKRAKVESKDHLLADILGYRPQTHVSIEYIESLGDWKTAWDHIHFRGFLGAAMTLQFIWQGCDSVLAAPLVLDLVRLTEAARRRGWIGRMPFLAPFFKSPYGVTEQAFDRQFEMLSSWARSKPGQDKPQPGHTEHERS